MFTKTMLVILLLAMKARVYEEATLTDVQIHTVAGGLHLVCPGGTKIDTYEYTVQTTDKFYVADFDGIPSCLLAQTARDPFDGTLGIDSTIQIAVEDKDLFIRRIPYRPAGRMRSEKDIERRLRIIKRGVR